MVMVQSILHEQVVQAPIYHLGFPIGVRPRVEDIMATAIAVIGALIPTGSVAKLISLIGRVPVLIPSVTAPVIPLVAGPFISALTAAE